MRILVIGSGSREHAIVWRLAEDDENHDLYVAPGNAGTDEIGHNIAISVDDAEGLLRFVKERDVDLTVVGPEKPLVEGLVDRFQSEGLKIVGPTSAAARLEGSKEFAKTFMKEHRVPTAAFRAFDRANFEASLDWIDELDGPWVVKADGLAAGKGVIICPTRNEAIAAVRAQLFDGAFGTAGSTVVIEEFMEGEEASVFALTDGASYRLLATAQDHKRIGEGDTGPNTGGMGAYAPAPVMTPEMMRRVEDEIIEPTLRGMNAIGAPYQGFLYAGLMITDTGPKVVEFNCRLGDPEAQVVLPLLSSSFTDLLLAAAEERLDEVEIELSESSAACVVLASEGYPGDYEKGRTIDGADGVTEHSDLKIFHAGTERVDGRLRTAGGRVLGVTAVATDLPQALSRVYDGVGEVSFQGMQFRRDIGQKGLKHEYSD